MSQLKKGAVLNYTTIFLINVGGLLLTPFILSRLGQEEYGIYITIGALVGTISLFDFGLNNTVVRFVAKYRAEKDGEGEENFLAVVMWLYLIIAGLVIISGLIFYQFIDSYFTKMEPDELHIAKMMFIILVLNLAVSLPGNAFTGICYGYEEFVFPKGLNIIKYITRSLSVVGLLLFGGKAVALVILDTVFNFGVIAITVYFVFKKLKVRIKLHNFSKKFVKEIFSYSTWIFVFAIVGIFQWKAGHWVLGRMSEPGVLAIYGIGITLGTYYGAFSTAISSVFLPRATQMAVDKASGEELTDMMIKIGRISFIVLMYVLGAFLFYGEQFVFLWVGGELGVEGSYQAWLIAMMIMLAYTLPLVQGFGNSILEAKNKLRFKAILYLSFMIAGTALGAFLAYDFGAVGMITGSVCGWIIVQNVMNIYYHRVITINIFRFFKELLKKTALAIGIAFGMAYLINFIPGSGWLNFVLKASVYSVIFLPISYYVGMIQFEKNLILDSLAPLSKFIKSRKNA
ncbi:lipopolysaccharide biosynthesis protein [Spongiivirga citrea]|uniref:Oligosaccharide flippase family protein n=1 Tax=Spongiivirga citrea TaxID=1481457 RepID=A0A6M0CCS0_9FLAO|nr:oligosaccharide flippase family protein [Spongiivirga citrea]NER15585.1 oligosaccharide flippase family protein [Spongiivirga citrea]